MIGTSTANRFNTFALKFGGNEAFVVNTDYASHNSDFRAPIFYDTNDTNYFGNFAGVSRINQAQLTYLGVGTAANTSGGYRINMGGSIDMNNNSIDYVTQLHFQDNVRFYDEGNDSYLNFKYGDSTTGGIKFYNGGGTRKGRHFLPKASMTIVTVLHNTTGSSKNYEVALGACATRSLSTGLSVEAIVKYVQMSAKIVRK